MLWQTMAFVTRFDVDLLTVVPRPILRGFWDRVANGFILQMSMFLNLSAINNPKSKQFNANGPFMLFSRKGYEGIGGHAAIAGEVWEDAILAKNIKENGFNLKYLFATELIDVRLYAHLRELLDGWTKIPYRQLELGVSSVLKNVLVVLFILFLYVTPWALGLWHLLGTLWGLEEHWLPLLLSLVAIGSIMALVRQVERDLQVGGSLHPELNFLGAIVLCIILWRATYRYVTGQGTTWKGASYVEAQKKEEE
jgi:chlorobactene glucosyltransferase